MILSNGRIFRAQPINEINTKIINTQSKFLSLLISLFLVMDMSGRDQDKFPEMYNVRWDSQSEDASGSMPVGGGDIGLNVWVENNQLMFYFQRSGVHDEFNGFPKLGRVRVWTEPSVFQDCQSFRQELKLEESCIEIEALHPEHGSIRIKLWVEVHNPIIHVEAESSTPLKYYSQYDSWRTKPRLLDNSSNLGEKWGWWDIEGWPYDVILEPDQFIVDQHNFTFYHVNPTEKLASRISYENMGLGDQYSKYYDPLADLVWGGRLNASNMDYSGKHEGTYCGTAFTGWRFEGRKPSKTQDIGILMHTSRCGNSKEWLLELDEASKQVETGHQKAWIQNLEWWKEFWNRSYLILDPDKKSDNDTIWQAGQNYNLFRYMTACNAYGENPTMFNGGLFTFDPVLVKAHKSFSYHPDWRRWGGGIYTLQNQRWVYWPMLKWGDSEHMHNQFNFFSRVLEVAEMRIRENYGHNGCLFSESATVYGLPTPMHYGYDSTHMPDRHRMKWMDPGMERNWAVGNHHTAQLEFSYMILQYYRYSGQDVSKWLPFVKSSLDFFDEHYRMRRKYYARLELDRNGKLVLFPSSTCESDWFATNPVPDIAGLHAVVNQALELPDNLINEFFEGRDELERLREILPDFHYEVIEGDTVMPPARSVAYPHYGKTEIYLNYPMFPFDIIRLGDKEMKYIINTHDHWAKYHTPRAWTAVDGWANGNVAYARMGMSNKASEMTLKTLARNQYRFPSFWGPGDWTPDHNWGGTGAVGLQEMLMQVFDDKIILMPAWDENIECDFKLHAPENTVIQGKIRKGKIMDLSVSPQSRRSDIIIN